MHNSQHSTVPENPFNEIEKIEAYQMDNIVEKLELEFEKLMSSRDATSSAKALGTKKGEEDESEDDSPIKAALINKDAS